MTNDNDDWGKSSDEINFDTDGVSADQCGSRLLVDQVGKYHFDIVDAENRFDKHAKDDMTKMRRQDILCTCVVVQSVPGLASRGNYYYQELPLSGLGGGQPEDWAKQKTTAFLVGVGVLVQQGDDVIDPETGTKKINVNTLADRLKSRQFIGDIKFVKSKNPQYRDKYELPFGRGAFEVENEAVASVPKNKATLELGGYDPKLCGNVIADGQTVTAEAETTANTDTQESTVNSEEFADL